MESVKLMTLTREQIVSAYVDMLGSEQVITDEQTLKENSADRYYKVETIFGIYSLPIPAAVVKPRTPQEVSEVLKFANRHGINVVPKSGGSAKEFPSSK